jgi:hypothetical protein
MGKGILLWLIGIPIPIILLLWIFAIFTETTANGRLISPTRYFGNSAK